MRGDHPFLVNVDADKLRGLACETASELTGRRARPWWKVHVTTGVGCMFSLITFAGFSWLICPSQLNWIESQVSLIWPWGVPCISTHRTQSTRRRLTYIDVAFRLLRTNLAPHPTSVAVKIHPRIETSISDLLILLLPTFLLHPLMDIRPWLFHPATEKTGGNGLDRGD
jgi:uncharacterized iron-regulated membrane protein